MRPITAATLLCCLMLTCFLVVSACSTETAPRPPVGTPVSETDLLNFMSGSSWLIDNGVRFHDASGTTQSFRRKENFIQACEGTWSVSGSVLLTDYRCNWKEDGQLYQGSQRKLKREVFWDGDGFLAIDEGTGRKGKIYFSETSKGFSRQEDFKEISEEVKL